MMRDTAPGGSFRRPAFLKRKRPGFTLFEVFVVVAIMGILMVATLPNFINAMHTRSLESAARIIQSNLQWAKLQAVKTKLNHRLRFEQQQDGAWSLALEREVAPDDWVLMPGFVKRGLPVRVNVTVGLPDDQVVYSSLGTVENFSSLMNTVILQSDRLKSEDQPDVREIRIFSGGSIQYLRASS